MNDELIKQLQEVLAKEGVEEEKIAAIIADLTVTDKGDPVPPASDPVPPADPIPADDQLPPSDPLPPDVDPVPPADPVPPVVDPNLTPDPTLPPAPAPFDPTELIKQIDDQKGLIDEQAKVIEGLNARIGSLEDALKKAGVIDNTTKTQVGLDNPQAPSNEHVDDIFDDILSDINKKY